MKNYFISILFLFSLVAVFGFILPALFSADSTEGVLLGVVILVVAIPCWVLAIKRFIKKTEETKK